MLQQRTKGKKKEGIQIYLNNKQSNFDILLFLFADTPSQRV